MSGKPSAEEIWSDQEETVEEWGSSGAAVGDSGINGTAIDTLASAIDFQNTGVDFSTILDTSGGLKEHKEILFLETSLKNNIAIQIFETNYQPGDTSSSKSLLKLDMIDFGTFNVDLGDGRINKRVFFAGKVFIDNFGIPTYFNIFTIVLD